MTIEYFAPKKVDTQNPHKQDEIYVIIKGHGIFYRNGERTSFKEHDLLFVPPGMEHRLKISLMISQRASFFMGQMGKNKSYKKIII